jgi:hypothetical protein
MRGWGTTRRALFEQLDRPAPQSLPPTPYEYGDWKRCRVNLDYHIEIAKHFYSVPFRLLRPEVEGPITMCWHGGRSRCSATIWMSKSRWVWKGSLRLLIGRWQWR